MPYITGLRRSMAWTLGNTAAAYTAGVAVGGLLTMPVQFPAGGGVLRAVRVVDADNIRLALNVLIFDSAPATTPANNVAYAPTAADLQNATAVVPLLTADYLTVGARALLYKPLAAPMSLTAPSGALWLAVLAAGSGTYTTPGGLQLALYYEVG
jgi:hypothetical protein